MTGVPGNLSKPPRTSGVLSSMSFPTETNPMRTLGRAIPILDVVELTPLNVVELAPLDVVERAPDPEMLVALPADAASELLTVTAAPPPWPVVVRCMAAVYLMMEWLVGIATLAVGLAVLAAIPILNFLSLGYLLESSARVARTGRLRDGFIGVRFAARLGAIVVLSFLGMLPGWIVADFARSAEIIDPGGKVAEAWQLGWLVLTVLTGLAFVFFATVGMVVWLAIRGVRGGFYTAARDAVWDSFVSLRLLHYFWLGLRGFVAAVAWLALPITLLVVSRFGHSVGASLLGFIGAFLLVLILPYLPFLQLRLATTNRFRGAFEVLAVRRDYRRAPWAFTFAFVVTLLSALPLYLLKIQIVPREAAWLPALVFIMFIFPARLLTGWAMGRANRLAARRPTPRHWFFRWTGRLPLLPAAAFYVLIVFFTQYTSWNGVWDLYLQHAFLVPFPFFGR